MAGPLGGIGPQQQLPIATALQGGANNQQARRAEEQEQPRDRQQVQPQGTQAAQTQNAETDNQNVGRRDEAQGFNVANNNQSEDASSGERGSLVDISV